MCGFSGVAFSCTTVRDNYQYSLEAFRKSASRIVSRGDSDHQELIHDSTWLSHYRLAFQDLEAGIQPMLSQDGEHVIVFNGEIYNHLNLRPMVERQSGIKFKTRSDTETILEGWKALGNDFFQEFDGEFAFVILNLNTNEIIAHRDRHGVKPLFFRLNGIDTRLFSIHKPNYSFDTDCLEFSSEIKGIPGKKSWQRDGLLRQFVGLYEPICTPFTNIIHIPAGAIFTATKQDDSYHCELKTNEHPIRYSGNTAVATEEEFEHVFRSAVKDRLLSDVELGVYLSGGVDSKSIAYELSKAKNKSGTIKSFTVGFQHEGYDETGEALRFAKHVGFNPHVLRVDSEALNYSYPLAIQSSELVQPYTNGAAKWWLSLFTRQYVNGVLTGDGADEVFGGYPSYRYANWWKFIMRGRGKAKTVSDVQRLLKRTPLGESKRDQLYVGRFSAHSKNPWLSGASAEGNGSDFVDSLKMWGVPHPLFGQIQAITHGILGVEEGNNWLKAQTESIQSIFCAGLSGLEDELANPEHALLLWQNYFAKSHLPVLILNWVGDRMEMSNTLEGRTPFMSKGVYDLMSRQRDTLLVHGLRDKVLLRRTFARLFPAEFALTPKKQFNAPFLDSENLVNLFHSESIFEKAGICDNQKFNELGQLSKQLEKDNPFVSTHLKTAQQTAIAMSIVDHCVSDAKKIERDLSIEKKYLATVTTGQ